MFTKEQILAKQKLALEGQKQMVQNQYELQMDQIDSRLVVVVAETAKLAVKVAPIEPIKVVEPVIEEKVIERPYESPEDAVARL